MDRRAKAEAARAEKAKKLAEEKSRRKRLRPEYQAFLKKEAGEDLVIHLKEQAGKYIARAMLETNRDHKATLIDTAAGVNFALTYLERMSANPVGGTRTRASTKVDTTKE